ALNQFAETFVIPVVEVRARCVNLSHDHPLHLGFEPDELLTESDLVLCVECDLPWIPSKTAINPAAKVVWIDRDPLGTITPMRTFPADKLLQGNAALILRELTQRGLAQAVADPDMLQARAKRLAALHQSQRTSW